MYPKIHNDDTACDFIDDTRKHYIQEYGEWENGVVAFGNGGDRKPVEFHQQKKMFVVLLVSIWFGD